MTPDERRAYMRAKRVTDPAWAKARDQQSEAIAKIRRLERKAEIQIRIDEALKAEVRREHAELNAPEDANE